MTMHDATSSYDSSEYEFCCNRFHVKKGTWVIASLHFIWIIFKCMTLVSDNYPPTSYGFTMFHIIADAILLFSVFLGLVTNKATLLLPYLISRVCFSIIINFNIPFTLGCLDFGSCVGNLFEPFLLREIYQRLPT